MVVLVVMVLLGGFQFYGIHLQVPEGVALVEMDMSLEHVDKAPLEEALLKEVLCKGPQTQEVHKEVYEDAAQVVALPQEDMNQVHVDEALEADVHEKTMEVPTDVLEEAVPVQKVLCDCGIQMQVWRDIAQEGLVHVKERNQDLMVEVFV